MKANRGTIILGIVVLALIVLSTTSYVHDKTEYNISQKFIEIRGCIRPTYNGQRVKYVKQASPRADIEIGLYNGDKLTLPYTQIMNILCK